MVDRVSRVVLAVSDVAHLVTAEGRGGAATCFRNRFVPDLRVIGMVRNVEPDEVLPDEGEFLPFDSCKGGEESGRTRLPCRMIALSMTQFPPGTEIAIPNSTALP